MSKTVGLTFDPKKGDKKNGNRTSSEQKGDKKPEEKQADA